MKVKIDVTADDIKKGKPADAEKCPVARAMRRAFDAAGIKGSIGVNDDSLSLTGDDFCFVKTPKVVKQFIVNFDAIADVKANIKDLGTPAKDAKELLKTAKGSKASCQPFSFSVNIPSRLFPKVEKKAKKAKK